MSMSSNANKIEKVETTQKSVVAGKREEFMQMIVSSMNQTSYKPTEAQVDKILLLEEKKMDYAYKSQMTIPAKYKWDYYKDLIYLALSISVLCLVLIYKPEFTTEVLTLVIGLLGGGAVGYTRGKDSVKDKNS